jgi:hypothetical protein
MLRYYIAIYEDEDISGKLAFDEVEWKSNFENKFIKLTDHIKSPPD